MKRAACRAQCRTRCCAERSGGAQLKNLGLQMPPKDKLTPDALGAWQKAEIAKWWPMIKAANVKVD